MSLKTEAALLRSWLARRDELATQRREAPLVARRHRRNLLERDVTRLEQEIISLERAPRRHPGRRWLLAGAGRGLLLSAAALAWVMGVSMATPSGRFDDPFRIVSMAVVPLIIWGVRR
ncbi:MAG: hypothetical protein ACO1OB_34345 [Archangium sp.]